GSALASAARAPCRQDIAAQERSLAWTVLPVDTARGGADARSGPLAVARRRAMSFDLFRPEIDASHPRLERLYEQAKADFWNDTTAIDWERPLTLDDRQRRALGKILSLIYYGERAALEVSAQLVPLVEDEQAKFVLACQVIEEAKHVSTFRRLLLKLDQI